MEDRFNQKLSRTLRLSSTEAIHLDNGWPPGSYQLFKVSPVRTGLLRVGYHFRRVRPNNEGAQIVRREFEIVTLAAGAARVVLYDHPYHFPICLGDEYQIPVPVDDPWGRLEDLDWDDPKQEPVPPLQYPPTSASDADVRAIEFAKALAPQLVEPRYHREERLLASLNTRILVSTRLQAGKVGRLVDPRIEVVPQGQPISVLPMIWHEVTEDVGGSSSRSGTELSADAIVPLRQGDFVWLSTGVTLHGQSTSWRQGLDSFVAHLSRVKSGWTVQELLLYAGEPDKRSPGSWTYQWSEMGSAFLGGNFHVFSIVLKAEAVERVEQSTGHISVQ